jgi:two-component system, NarL family, nitrate/nitrite response regulator NarL
MSGSKHHDPAPSALPRSGQTGAGSPDRVRCVIIDDNDRFVILASRVLGRDGLSVVGTASDGSEALRLIADVRPDVALVDLRLGSESGIDVISNIVRADLADPPAMILISNLAEDELRRLFEPSAADAYLANEPVRACHP